MGTDCPRAVAQTVIFAAFVSFCLRMVCMAQEATKATQRCPSADSAVAALSQESVLVGETIINAILMIGCVLSFWLRPSAALGRNRQFCVIRGLQISTNLKATPPLIGTHWAHTPSSLGDDLRQNDACAIDKTVKPERFTRPNEDREL